MTKKNQKDNENPLEGALNLGLGGMLGGLTGIIEKLSELAEKGEELSKTVEFSGANQEGKEIKGIYGFTIKTAAGGNGEPRVEPFGNIRRDAKSGNAVVQEIREPVVDLFEEEDHILIIAEMPGVTAEDVKLEVKDDLLTLSATKGERKYRKEILLPASIPSDKMNVNCNNGVIEIKCEK